jgi:putative SOS response-associated peptidase YedK
LKKLKIYLANARVEEVETKKTYAPLMDTQRCVAVFSHFFEWRHEKPESPAALKKIKHRVFRQDGEAAVYARTLQQDHYRGRTLPELHHIYHGSPGDHALHP